MSVQPEFVDPEPVVAVNYPIVLRFQGLSPRNLLRFRMHDERREVIFSHVDLQQTPQNEVLFGEEDWIPKLQAEIAQAKRSNLEEHCAALRAKSRQKEADQVEERGLVDPWRASDHGPLREGILTVNKSWFGGTAHDRWDMGRVMQFRDEAMKFLRENFPDGQLRYASGHSDEEAYHIHFVMTVWTEKHSANRGRQFLLQPALNPLIARYEHAQDIVGDAFANLGMVRGEKRAEAIREAKAAGEAVPKRRRHIPPSVHRKMELLESYVKAGRVRRKSEETAARILAVAEADAATTRDQVKDTEERAQVRAALIRQDAIADADDIRNEARDLGAHVIRKSRKRAIRAAKAHRAEQRQCERAVENARRAAVEAERVVNGYEGRADQAVARMTAVVAERRAAELARDDARRQADEEATRRHEAVELRRAEEARLQGLKVRQRSVSARLEKLTTAIDQAEYRMNAAVIGAEAVELGLNAIAGDVLRGTESNGEPGIEWGRAAPPEPSARIRLLEAVRPAEPLLLRITRLVSRMVRDLLARERRVVADDAKFLIGLRDDWPEEQRARLDRIANI